MSPTQQGLARQRGPRATIGNPMSWAAKEVAAGAHAIARTEGAVRGTAAPPATRRLSTGDLTAALKAGWADMAASRTDAFALLAIYPLVVAVLYWVTLGQNLWHLIFPVMTGLAFLGPVAAVFFQTLSRRRAEHERAVWSDAWAVRHAGGFGAMLVAGFALLFAALLWVTISIALYQGIVGTAALPGLGAFLGVALGSGAGLAMLVLSLVIGLAFAAAVFSLTLVTFPLLLERDIGLPAAVKTSATIVRENPGVAARWAAMVAGLLILGAIPALLGLVIVVPVLGHATWHLYRRAVV